MSLIRRRPDRADGQPALNRLDPSSEMAAELPALLEFLTMTTWEGGQSRETGSLTLFFEEGLLKCCLSDKDGGLVAFASGASLDALLGRVETGLAADSLDWRRARENGGGRPRR